MRPPERARCHQIRALQMRGLETPPTTVADKKAALPAYAKRLVDREAAEYQML